MVTLRIALAQSTAHVGDVARNTAQTLTTWRTASEAGADLVVFPELALIGYPPDDLLLRGSVIAQATAAVDQLRDASPPSTAAVIGTVGHSHRRRPRDWGIAGAVPDLANQAVVLSEGETRGTYDKMRLPNEGVFDEARYFVPGERPLVTPVADVPVGVVICQDLWMTDGPLALTAEAGARVVAVLNASPYHRGKRQEREFWVQHHARKHGVWVCYVNRVGGQDEVVFDGDSMVADPTGDIVARGGQFCEDLVIVDIDLEARSTRVPSDEHAPHHALEPVAELWAALVTATRDYCHKNGFTEAILGLSGGIDSAVTAAIAVEALGSDAVLGVALPSPYSSTHSLEDARTLARLLGIRCETLPIGPALTAVSRTLDGLVVTGFDGEQQGGVAYENLQSRLRGLLLMALSNERGSILLTTGNKSEYAVGYATLYGDMAGGFAPLKDVLKGEVYALANFANTSRPRIPESTVTKPPSAELRPGQLDADALPDYERLDSILVGLVEDLQDIEALVAAGHDREEVARIMRLVDRAEHKRRQSAPGPKISRRAFGRERRVPITTGVDETSAGSIS